MAVNDPQIDRLDLITSEEVQKITGWHRNTVLKYAKNSKLLGSRLNEGDGDWVFRRSEVKRTKAEMDAAEALRETENDRSE